MMSILPIVYLTRKETFSASHRLHSPLLSDEVNVETYGKCNNPNGHGHNYTVEVTVRGPVDAKTGMVMNISILKEYMDIVIMKNLDHKNLDKDVSFFQSLPSTAENIAIYIWDNIKTRMSRSELLYEIKLYETEKNIVTYRGNLSSSNSVRRHFNSMSSDSD